MRLSTKGKLIERISIKIRVYNTGKWEWQVRQNFSKNPQISLQDFVKILDEIKQETIAVEDTEP